MVIGLLTTAADAKAPLAGRVTPKNLAPAKQQLPQPVIDIGAFAGATPPQGAELIRFNPGGVTFTGDSSPLPDALTQVQQALAPGPGRTISVADLFIQAYTLERRLAEAGYVLYRVVIPPQAITPGQPVIFRIISGHIEAVDTAALPAAIRSAVEARLQKLMLLKPVRRSDLERTLLLAGDFGGLALRSTFAPGLTEGGVRLIVDGAFDRFTGAISGGRIASEDVGGWGINVTAALNSAFGHGEQLYAVYQGDPETTLDTDARMRVAATGAVIPLDDDGLAFSPEIAWSQFYPHTDEGVPENRNTMLRGSLRLNYPVIRLPGRTLLSAIALDAITQTVDAIDFDLPLSTDSYLALRASLQGDAVVNSKLRLSGTIALAQGLGDIDPLLDSNGDAPPTRDGADSYFTKLNATAGASSGWGPFDASLFLRGQTSFGQPLFNSEQFSIDGEDALSSLSPGSYSVDEGATARAEVSATRPLPQPLPGTITPYLYGALGGGWMRQASDVESDDLTAASLGGGLRIIYAPLPEKADPLQITLEAGRSWVETLSLDKSTRLNFTLGWTF